MISCSSTPGSTRSASRSSSLVSRTRSGWIPSVAPTRPSFPSPWATSSGSTKMLHDRDTLWNGLSFAGHLLERVLWGVDARVTLGDLTLGSSLGDRHDELRGRSVLVATTDQLTAALALIELDGVAQRLV